MTWSCIKGPGFSERPKEGFAALLKPTPHNLHLRTRYPRKQAGSLQDNAKFEEPKKLELRNL